jgi:hypothetical protein
MRLQDGNYITVAPIIDNPDAYAKATRARIIANANKTFTRTYSDYSEIEGFLSAGVDVDAYGRKIYKEGFVGSLASAYANYGKLTEKQVLAIRKCLEANKARRAEWADKKAILDATRQHIGTIGEKLTLMLTLKKRIQLEGAKFSYYDSGITDLCIFEDADNNIVIYKGRSSDIEQLNEGDTATIRATIKDHGVRNGVKQTIIQRPKTA